MSTTHNPEATMPTTTETAYWQALSAQYETQFKAAWGNLCANRHGWPRTPVATGFGGTVMVNTATFAPDTDIDTIVDGTATPLNITATEDGRPAHLAVWHEGPTTGESVYAERWTPEGRIWHGYVDPTSRRIVQFG